MELNTLKRMRLIIPGILILIVTFLFYINSFQMIQRMVLEFKNTDILFIIAIIVFGALYYILDLRYKVFKHFLEKVHENIKDSLIKPFENEFTIDQIAQFKKGRLLLNIFYNIIDNDNSLSEKAKIVRDNGLIWTTSIDISIIFSISSIIFLIKYFFTVNELNDLIKAIILLVISIVSFSGIFVLTNKHIKLSNEQLECIVTIHKKKLKDKLDEQL